MTNKKIIVKSEIFDIIKYDSNQKRVIVQKIIKAFPYQVRNRGGFSYIKGEATCRRFYETIFYNKREALMR
ncbi:MAG: hypothetical protein PUB46_12315 [Lachnospiraceae bacterium]|uniref:hypothetical protein n=1 Tax=Roseburia hominis TaxID=301301 RepID=UPI001F1F7AA7|nr:hypothetical protein [Roseburia hominis]MDD6170830.1 hypothetical protein [Lachnospiraceae bacterium]